MDTVDIRTEEIPLNVRVERAIQALEAIGDPTPEDLNPVGLSDQQKQLITKDQLLNVAKLQSWLDVLENLKPEDKTARTELLKTLLDERILQASQIISSSQIKQ